MAKGSAVASMLAFAWRPTSQLKGKKRCTAWKLPAQAFSRSFFSRHYRKTLKQKLKSSTASSFISPTSKSLAKIVDLNGPFKTTPKPSLQQWPLPRICHGWEIHHPPTPTTAKITARLRGNRDIEVTDPDPGYSKGHATLAHQAQSLLYYDIYTYIDCYISIE